MSRTAVAGSPLDFVPSGRQVMKSSGGDWMSIARRQGYFFQELRHKQGYPRRSCLEKDVHLDLMVLDLRIHSLRKLAVLSTGKIVVANTYLRCYSPMLADTELASRSLTENSSSRSQTWCGIADPSQTIAEHIVRLTDNKVNRGSDTFASLKKLAGLVADQRPGSNSN